MRPALTSGRWFEVGCKEQHDNLKRCGNLVFKEYQTSRVQMGTFVGPGRYLLLHYQQRCPRNCCYDDVNEVLSAQEVVDECRQEMLELAAILRKAKEK